MSAILAISPSVEIHIATRTKIISFMVNMTYINSITTLLLMGLLCTDNYIHMYVATRLFKAGTPGFLELLLSMNISMCVCLCVRLQGC